MPSQQTRILLLERGRYCNRTDLRLSYSQGYNWHFILLYVYIPRAEGTQLSFLFFLPNLAGFCLCLWSRYNTTGALTSHSKQQKITQSVQQKIFYQFSFFFFCSRGWGIQPTQSNRYRHTPTKNHKKTIIADLNSTID